MFAQNLAQGKIAAEGRNVAEAFRSYIEQIALVPTQLEKVRLAQQAFGKQWQSGLLLAAQGAEEFKLELERQRAEGAMDVELVGILSTTLSRASEQITDNLKLLAYLVDEFMGAATAVAKQPPGRRNPDRLQ